jgi:hypothetical protein
MKKLTPVLSAVFLLFLAFAGAVRADDAVCPEDLASPSAEARQVLAVDDHGRGYTIRKASTGRPEGAPPRGSAPDFSAQGGLRLEGVMSSAGKALAIIDGGLYREGDCVEGFLITSIQRDRVTLEKGGRKASLVIR